MNFYGIGNYINPKIFYALAVVSLFLTVYFISVHSPFIIYLIGFFLVLYVVYQIYHLYKILNKKNQKKYTINFEHEAHNLWLKIDEEMEIKKNTRKSALRDGFVLPEPKFTTNSIANFWKWLASKDAQVLMPSAYTMLAYDILTILDENATLPSVSSAFKSDPENDEIVSHGDSSYEKLKQITIADHIVNVANAIVNIAQKEMSRDLARIYFAQMIIVALAHDLGKITRILYLKDKAERAHNLFDENEPEEHAVESRIKFEEILSRHASIKDSEKNKMIEAIVLHHTVINNPKQLITSLKTADHDARNLEMSQIVGIGYIPSTQKQDRKTVASKQTDYLAESSSRVKDVSQTSETQPLIKQAKTSSNLKDERLYNELLQYIWKAFVENIRSTKKGYDVYHFGDKFYINVHLFGETIEAFYREKDLENYFEQDAFGIREDSNKKFAIRLLSSKGDILDLDGNSEFRIVDIMYTSERVKPRVPMMPIKESSLCNNRVLLKEVLKTSPFISAIKSIQYSEAK